MTIIPQRTIAIVDAYSSASKLPPLLKEWGCRVIHVKSCTEIPEIYKKSYRPHDFQVNLEFTGDTGSLADKLRLLGVTDIIAGAESGIAVADRLAEMAGLPGNPSATSTLRRNKYLMGEAIKKHGINAVLQEEISSVEEARSVARAWNIWPLVIKPLDSAGSDGVAICHDEAQLVTGCRQLLKKRNRLDIPNSKILLQERMFGQQYIVNTLSFYGKHYITEMWCDNRREIIGAGLIYDYEVLIDHIAPEWGQLRAYALQVLQALDVRYGPCHIEIMMTTDGPKLIELGARMQGGISSAAIVEAIGESHLTLTARLLCEPEKLLNDLATPYKIRKHIMTVALIVQNGGEIVGSRLESLVGNLPSFSLFLIKPGVGDVIARTIDLFTCPGIIYLLSDSADQIMRDYRQIRQWEENSQLFDLKSADM